jgi:membrane protein implicated in regulation of membrane protease activity
MITIAWIIVSIILLTLNYFTKNILFKVIGIACLVVSTSSYIITKVFSNYPQYLYLKIALLIILGAVIFFFIRNITKINIIPDSQKKNREIDVVNEEAN